MWRRRLVWFVLGVLAVAIPTYALPYLFAYAPPLSNQQRVVLAEFGFEPIVKVREIHTRHEVPVEVVIRERFEVEVPSAPVEVIRDRFVEVPRETEGHEVTCPELEEFSCPVVPPQYVDIAGGCEIEVAGDMARAWWACDVMSSDQGWSATRGPELADQVRFRMAENAQEPRYRRHWLVGPLKWDDGWGLSAGLSWEGNKYRLTGLASVVPRERLDPVKSDGFIVSFLEDKEYEPMLQLLAGRRF